MECMVLRYNMGEFCDNASTTFSKANDGERYSVEYTVGFHLSGQGAIKGQGWKPFERHRQRHRHRPFGYFVYRFGTT